MFLHRIALASFAAVALAGAALADASGYFLYRLGVDTTSVEHYTRSADKWMVDQVGRALRTLRRLYSVDLKGGAVTHVSMAATPPGAAAATQTVDASFDPDSARL